MNIAQRTALPLHMKTQCEGDVYKPEIWPLANPGSTLFHSPDLGEVNFWFWFLFALYLRLLITAAQRTKSDSQIVGHVKKWGAGEETGLSVQSVDYHVLKADFLPRDQYFQKVFESRELASWNLGLVVLTLPRQGVQLCRLHHVQLMAKGEGPGMSVFATHPSSGLPRENCQ